MICAAVFREQAREVVRPPSVPVLGGDADHEARPDRLRESESSMRVAPPAPERTNCTVATFSWAAGPAYARVAPRRGAVSISARSTAPPATLTGTAMATSLLALLDDIATILDDVSLMTKVAAKKTAGVLGDDLALNAQQVTGVKADRELPVVWAVAKGSLLNKAILVPAALAISAFASWAVTPLLMIGGAFLCFEGVEKLAHRFLHSAGDDAHRKEQKQALADPAIDLLALEKSKIKGAVRTDFILSAEIIAITLGTTAGAAIGNQFAVLATVALAMTVFVYGLVAGIVKLDDLGLALSRRSGAARSIGLGILTAAPWLMKTLSVVGTAAMFLVGGGIVVHGVPVLQLWVQGFSAQAGGALGWAVEAVLNAGIGAVVGAVVLLAWTGIQRLRGKR